MGIVDWGEYNESHEYQKAYTFNETKDVTFVISDWYDEWYDSPYNNQNAMDDNSGELSLDIYKCVASENGNEENGTTTTTIVTAIPGPTGSSIGGQFAPPEGIVLGESVTRGEEGIVAGAYCEPYLYEYIKYGADNNPVEVKKLQSFLNEYLGISLALSGVYDEQTYNAVKQFQLLMKYDILAPWVDNGCLPAEDIATGYVYRTTKWAINNMFCPTPRPDISDEKCYPGDHIGLGNDLDGQILGESIVLGEEEILLDSTENEESLDNSEEELIKETEETEETSAQGILIALIALLGLGGLAYIVFRGRMA